MFLEKYAFDDLFAPQVCEPSKFVTVFFQPRDFFPFTFEILKTKKTLLNFRFLKITPLRYLFCQNVYKRYHLAQT